MAPRRILFPLALALVLAAPLAGCRSEQRVCDEETGVCYYCDGLGCREVGDGRQCSGDDDCEVGEYCSAGACIVEGAVCQFNHECGAGRVCLDGGCTDGCAVDDDCTGDGQVCVSGACRCESEPCDIDDTPRPFCLSDAECAQGHPCVGGICRTTCDTHETCLQYDVHFNFCLDGYCATTNEVTSDCFLSADCDGGQECIDGVCR
jgi:hypothetical protein